MILSFNYQLMMFIATILMGGVMGISYDAIRITRRIIKRKGIIVQAEDAVYWLSAALWAFMVMLDRFNGEVRIFSIIGIGTGMAIYFASLSRPFLKLVDGFIQAGKRNLEKIANPFGRFCSVIIYPVKKLINLAGKRTKKVLHLCEVCAKLKMKHFVRDIKTVFKK